ncbi:MAG: matrixin family metalloprotease [Gemmataceae bacterium]
MTRRTRPLCLEILEDRTVLSSPFNVPWPDASHLTLSFVQDGTNTQGTPSSLFHTLAPLGTASTWEHEILRAFQSWAVNANINIGVTTDGGQAQGTLGAVQGDSRFGDIRISAAPLGSGELASASPFSWTGTTWSGDVVLNSNYAYTIGNQPNAYDLYSVFVHEAGHTFGLSHSPSTADVMYEQYGYHTGLSADDISRLQTLYLPRPGASGNNSFATANSMGLVLTSIALNGGISDPTEADYYSAVTLPPLFVTAVTVQLKASGLSQLLARVSVYDGNQRLLASAVASDPLNPDLTLTIGGISLGMKYYVKVESATPGLNDVGTYQLRVGYGLANLGGLLAPIYNVVTGGLNGVLGAATTLTSTSSGPNDHHFEYTYQQRMAYSSEVDYFKVQARVSSAPQTMVALVWALNGSTLNPRLHVYDAAGNPVGFQVLADQAGLFSLQVPNAVSGATYYVAVAAQDPNSANSTGAYFLGVDYSPVAPLAYDTLGSNTLASTASVDAATLSLTENKLMEFSLSATTASGGAAVTMTLLDSSGNVVLSLTAQANRPSVTGSIYLKAGTYTVRYTARAVSGSAFAPVAYQLNTLDLSDPVSTYASSTSSGTNDTSSGGDGSGGYTYSGSSSSQSAGYQYWF